MDAMDLTIVEVLEQAGSQEPAILKTAEQTLKQWETERGFYTALFNVFSNHSFPVKVRWMAVVYFKNGVDMYWRKNAPHEIHPDEKVFLRRGLIAKFDEPVNQLAIQLAELIGRIARYDCPKEWESLVPTLLEVAKSDNSLVQHRALLTFHHVVKALSSKRLAADRQLFEQLTLNVFNYILNLWNTFTESFFALTTSETNAQQIQDTLEKALLSLKILKKLVIGISKPSEKENIMFFLKIIFERTKTSLECRKSLISRGIQLEVCDKFIINLTKIFIGLIEIHPSCFIDLILPSLEFTVFYCFTEAGQSLAFERFTLQCMNLLKNILHENHYKVIKRNTKDPNALSSIAHQHKQEFFTSEILTEICTRLVTYYLVLTPADLEFWDSDPESFGVDDGGESSKYSLRPCAESVFREILHLFKDNLSSVLVDLMQKHHQPVDPNDLHAILLKDAVYNAVGLAGFDLYDEVNFDQWFATTLKLELKERSNNYRIIRRRVCWLIGRWAGVKLSTEFRPELYNLMIEALNPDEDLGVRLAASDALKLAIDDFQFNTDDFVPFVEKAFSLLFCLLKEVNECYTKMRVLYVMSFMIERIGNEINPHIASLNTYLPELWKESENHNMLRCAIVSTLVQLVKALGSDSIVIQPFVVSVVEVSCDMNQDGHVYLLEEGLDLWLALLENSPASTPGITSLYKNMPALLDSSSENLKMCLYIIEAYILLNPQDFLLEKGPVIVESLRSILGDLRPEGIIMVMRLLVLCLKVSPEYGIQLLKPLFMRIFENVCKQDSYPLVLTMYLSIIARILLNSTDTFIKMVKELSKIMGNEYEDDQVLGGIIQTYVNHMPSVPQQKKRKLLALALCSLLGSSYVLNILQYFSQIITNIVETLNDITKTDDMGASVDSLMINQIHDPSELEDIGYENEHSQRKRRLIFNDPVHCIVLANFLENQLNALQKYVGDNYFNQLMQTISLEVDQQLKVYVKV